MKECASSGFLSFQYSPKWCQLREQDGTEKEVTNHSLYIALILTAQIFTLYTILRHWSENTSKAEPHKYGYIKTFKT